MALGVALIGSGIFIKEEHLPAVLANPNFSLKAIYSRSLKTAQSLTTSNSSIKDIELYSDDGGSGKTYHDLLLRADIHAVIIALPINNQPEFIEAALVAGKHVLSEKPIAENLKSAEHLVKFYREGGHAGHGAGKIPKGITWGVAENFRYMESFAYARESVEKLGRLLGFQVKMFTMVKPGGKYIETEWRKTPTHQGGFLLDGGVHIVAGTRLVLGKTHPTAISAYTTLLQKHLPPVDTVNSIWTTKTGVAGTFSVSLGTTLSGNEYIFGCEKGTVTVARSKVTVVDLDGNENVKEFPNEGSGVMAEVAAWADGLLKGKPNAEQSPEQALADLEILDKMLRSGEGHGKTESLQFQI